MDPAFHLNFEFSVSVPDQRTKAPGPNWGVYPGDNPAAGKLLRVPAAEISLIKWQARIRIRKLLAPTHASELETI